MTCHLKLKKVETEVAREMQTGNALYVADMGKNSSVRMAKTRPPNERMYRDYPVVHLTITDQKFSSRRRKCKRARR